MGLTTSLAAFWDFNADDATDQHTGSVDWTENGTVTYGAGTPGRAVTVGSGSGNNLSITDANAAALDITSAGWTFCYRGKANSFPVSFNTIYSKGGTSSSDAGITITHTSASEFFVRLADGTNQAQLTFNNTTIGTATEYFLWVRVDWDSDLLEVGVNDVAPDSVSTSALVPANCDSNDSASHATAFQNNGDFTTSLMAIWNRPLSDAEIDYVQNGTEGITYVSELVRDGWNPATNCARWLIEAKAAEIGGTGTQVATHLVITDADLKDSAKDSDETYHITSANLRASLDSAGTKQIPVKVVQASPNATPANAEYEIWVLPIDHFGGDNTLDGTNGTDIYLWWGLSGAAASPETGMYGGASIFNGDYPFALLDTDFSDATRLGNDGTGTSMNTNSTDAPYGNFSFSFSESSTSRIVISHDPSLNVDVKGTIEFWFNTNGISSAYQGFVNKRRSSTANYTTAIHTGVTDEHNAFYVESSTFYGASATYSTNHSNGTWYHVIYEYEDDGTNVDVEIFKNAASIATHTRVGSLVTNSEDCTIGAIQVGGASWNQGFDGELKGVLVYKDHWSADQKTTRYNNQSDTSTFWDTTAAVDQPSSGVTGTGSVTEGGEAISGTGSVLVSGTAAITEGGETISSTGTVLVSGTGSVTEGGETVAGTGSALEGVVGTGAVTEGGETVASTGSVFVSGTGALIEGGETISGVGSVFVSGTGSLTEGGEAIVGVGTVSSTRTGTGAFTEGGEVISGTGLLFVSGTGAITEGGEAISGTNVVTGTVQDIALSASPYYNIAMSAKPHMNIELTAEPYVN